MRALGALAAGLAIGVILIEAISSGLTVLLPEALMRVEAADGYGGALVWPLLPTPALVWLFGGLAAGCMAAAAGPHPALGLAAGALLALPPFLLVGLVTPGNPAALLAAALPLAGSAAGTALVARLRHEAVSTSDQAV
ncbi:MAG TPA: hypothetical protein VK972_07900 [Wenzhouxiangella sp.]|nr:hypothetical protein [Wenzhouxiangella sp.]